MPVPDTRTIPHYRGDSLGVLIRLWQDPDHTVPLLLNGALVVAQLRLKADDPDPPIDTFAVSTATNEITLTLTPTQPAALPAKTVWDCQVDWNADGASIQTVLAGTLTLAADVTRT